MSNFLEEGTESKCLN